MSAGQSNTKVTESSSKATPTIKRRKSLRLSKKAEGEISVNSFDGSVKEGSKLSATTDSADGYRGHELLSAFQDLKKQDNLSAEELAAAAEADKYLDNFSLKYARSNPVMYLRVLGKP